VSRHGEDRAKDANPRPSPRLGPGVTMEKIMPKTRSVKTGCSAAKPRMPPMGSVTWGGRGVRVQG
jgi:hypothetical protein